MPKGKKCEVCKEGRMRRTYTRSYRDGIRFTEEYIIGIKVKKGSFNPKGWICDNCGIFIPDKENYFMHRNWTERKEKQKEKVKELRYKLKKYRVWYMEQVRDYPHSEAHLQNMIRLIKFRAINWYGEKGTRSFLRGLKEGRKISDKSWEEKFEREKLTDDQIIKLAERIKRERKHGIRV